MTHLADIPIQKLLFYLSDYDESLAGEMEDFVERLCTCRSWVIQPPVFVNEGENESETLGGYLSLYSALPPVNLPPEIDRLHFEEVKEAVSRLQEFSKTYGVTIQFELDGIDVGQIDNGRMEDTLRVGLLEEWERVLSSKAVKQ